MKEIINLTEQVKKEKEKMRVKKESFVKNLSKNDNALSNVVNSLNKKIDLIKNEKEELQNKIKLLQNQIGTFKSDKIHRLKAEIVELREDKIEKEENLKELNNILCSKFQKIPKNKASNNESFEENMKIYKIEQIDNFKIKKMEHKKLMCPEDEKEMDKLQALLKNLRLKNSKVEEQIEIQEKKKSGHF